MMEASAGPCQRDTDGRYIAQPLMQTSVTLFFLLADCVQSVMTDLSVLMVPSSVIFTLTLETKPLKSWASAWEPKHRPTT